MWRDRAPTLADLHRHRFLVTVRCKHCQVELTVRLHVLAGATGWDYVPWGRSCRCRRFRCIGRMRFFCYPPQTNQAVEMF